MRIAIFGNTYQQSLLTHIQVIINFFKDKDVKLLFDETLYSLLTTKSTENIEVIDNDDFQADVVLSMGGDGTFLKTASHIGNKQIPILGINIGRLGFLADVPDTHITQALEALLRNEYKIEERTLLHLQTSDNTIIEYPFALNDIAILKQDASSMISINTSVNGEAVHTYQADGLLIATPTGSTAYSMSVGGPIVVPQAENIILSPVASHSLNVRPLIIPDTWDIELEVFSRTNSFLVAVDGRSKVLNQSTKLRITKADYTIKVLKQQDYTFFDTLKNKLMWGVDKRN